MNNQEIKALSAEDLAANLAREEARLQKLKFAHAITPLENTGQIREARKQVARFQTEITARKLTQA
ncbi:MAG: 50S ribosomal protein L29 [Bacteroidota bacterium]